MRTCNSLSKSPKASNRGSNTKPMKEHWDDGLVILSLSINGVTGSPSNFSASLCLKNSCNNLSNHNSATSIGLASLDMSDTLIKTIQSLKRKLKFNEK